MAKRAIEIKNEMKVLDVRGLSPPSGQPNAHPFFWTKDGHKRPSFLRWSWNPITGDLLVGDVQRHIHHMPKDYPLPVESWLRGFLFTRERLFAVRSFFWPADPYEVYDRDLDDNICGAATPILLQVIPTATVELHIDNRWLYERFGNYSTTW